MAPGNNTPSDFEIGQQLGVLNGKMQTVETSLESVWGVAKEASANAKEATDTAHQTKTCVDGLCERLDKHMRSEEAREERLMQLEKKRQESSQKHHRQALIPRKPWEMPIGELLFQIVLKALMVVGVGLVAALIIMGVNKINL